MTIDHITYSLHLNIYNNLKSQKSGIQNILNFLIDNGADITTVNKDNNTALILSIENGNHSKVVKFFCNFFLHNLKEHSFLLRFIEFCDDAYTRRGSRCQRCGQ